MSIVQKSALNVGFLREVYYAQVRLDFEVEEDVELPPFAGSSLRGALGHALRDQLCSMAPQCADECAQPETCQYFALFEITRGTGEGSNLPKALILDPPVPWELQQIALGAPCQPPYKIQGSDSGGLPRLSNQHEWRVPVGSEFSARITLPGNTSVLLPALIQVLQRARLRIGGGRFQLCRTVDTALGGRVLWDRAEGFPLQPAMRQDLSPLMDAGGPVRRLVIGFITPVRLRGSRGEYCFSAPDLAQRFWGAALVRAMRVHDAFCNTGQRLPWMELPPSPPPVQRCSVYHYVLPRLSFRQRAFMDFDGLVGNVTYTDVPGELAALARAAELLHIGQKATFGLGRVRCIVLDK